MRKLIEKISTNYGIEITLEHDTERDIYILTIERDGEREVFEGSLEDIQEASHKYFVNSLKRMKNQLEVLILEEMYKKSPEGDNL